MVIEFEDPEEIKKLASVYPNGKIPAFGQHAYIGDSSKTDLKFGEKWIRQEKKEGSPLVKKEETS